MVSARSTKICVVLLNLPILDLDWLWSSMCRRYDMYYIGIYDCEGVIRINLQSSCKRKMTMCYVTDLFDSCLPSMDNVYLEQYSSCQGVCLHCIGRYRGRTSKCVNVKSTRSFGEESIGHITSRHLDALSSRYFTDGVFDGDSDPMEVVCTFANEILTLDSRNINVYGSIRSDRIHTYRIGKRFPLGLWWVSDKRSDILVDIFKVWFFRLEDSITRHRCNLNESSRLFLDDIVRIFTIGGYYDTQEFKNSVSNKTLISLENYKTMFNANK